VTERYIIFALPFSYLKRRWQKITVLFPYLTPLVKPLSRALNLGKRILGALSTKRKAAETKNRANT
jgi:hypothetical protein